MIWVDWFKLLINIEMQKKIVVSKDQENRLIEELRTNSDLESQRVLKFYDMPDLSRIPWNPVNLMVEKLKSLPRYKDHIEIEIPEVVWTYETFDLFDFSVDHPARSKSDTYYVNNDMILRTHTSVMWYYLFQNNEFQNYLENAWEATVLCYGKVYRKDEIDRKHSNVFHQIDWVYICEKNKKILQKQDLEDVLVELAKWLFGDNIEYRVLDDTFPYTDPSLQIEVNIMWDWIEMLWSWIIKPSVMKKLWLDPDKYNAWAFGPGIDRLAMIKMEIPDIRLLRSTDSRVLKQWWNIDNKYQDVSKYPSTYRDISFVISKEVSLNNYYEIIQDFSQDLIEEVVMLDRYENDEKFGKNKVSYTFRIIYRSHERTLINDEINEIQQKIRIQTQNQLDAKLR